MAQNTSRVKVASVAMSSTYNAPKLAAKPIVGEFAKWGEANQFPQQMLRLFKESPTHGAIIRAKSKMIVSSGIEATDIIEAAGTEEEIVKANNAYLNKMVKGRFNRFLRKITLDFEINNAFAIQVVWSLDRTKIVQMHYQDISEVRIEVDEDGDLVQYHVAEVWGKDVKSTKDAIAIKPFDPEAAARRVTVGDQEVYEETGIQLYVYFSHAPGVKFYTEPEYFAATTDIETDIEYRTFYLYNIKGGLMPTLILQVLKDMDEDEWDDFKRDVNLKFEGSKGSRYLLVKGDQDAEGKPYMQVDQIHNKAADGKGLKEHENAIQMILSGHQLPSPTLAGIPTKGRLSVSGKEMEFAWKLWEENYSAARREELLEELVDLLQSGGYPESVLTITPRNPFQFQTESTAE